MGKQEVLQQAKDANVQFIRLWFTDVLGTLKSFAITADELEDALDGGMGFDGSSITGYQDIEESDMIAMPDPSTFKVIPWSPQEEPTARMICDVQTPDGDPYVGDPRHILRRALERASEMGFDTFNVGPELEFFYFKDSNGTEPLDYGGYFDLTTLDAATALRRETVQSLQQLGIKVEYSHHEVGISQHEIDLRFDDAMTMADKVMTYKTVVKEIATRHGVYATFMPKPLIDQNGSGMHTHQSLFSERQERVLRRRRRVLPLGRGQGVYRGTAPPRPRALDNLRPARQLLQAAWSPATRPRSTSPGAAATARRSSAFPLYHPGQEKATRMELRCPDPAANIYLCFAALLHAGLEGIEKGYELPEPMERNLYNLSVEEREKMGIESLPADLGEAIKEAENSELLRKALGEHTYSRLLQLKREEFEDYRIQVTPYEIKKFLPVL
jgi:glutamine synthetase